MGTVLAWVSHHDETPLVARLPVLWCDGAPLPMTNHPPRLRAAVGRAVRGRIAVAVVVASGAFVVGSCAITGRPPSAIEPATTATYGPRPRADGPLRDLARYRGIAIGSAAQPELIASNSTYAGVLGSQFDMVTAENAMKWPAVHPDPNHYDFAAADALVAFARQHHMAVRGHNLLTGGTNTASWVLNGTFSRAQLTTIVRDHITTEVSHFRGQVVQWDVVNEALDPTGQLEANVWQRGIGSDYIDKAFTWAHAADPHALLFYNEDDVACDVCSARFPVALEQHRDEAIYRLVAGMRHRGVPIDGVGLQMHLWSSPPDTSYLEGFFRRLRDLGLQVAVTEMDVRLPDSVASQDLGLQADVYSSVLRACLASSNCRTFVVWGFSDATSWIPSFIPGFGTGDLYDANYQPKPAFYALQRTLAGP